MPKFKSTCVIGMQWGDEAKAKVVDIFADDADVVVRSTGGANAGHTVVIDGQKFILHLIPAGVLHPDTENIIGNGVVFDPAAFFEEASQLAEAGIKLDGRVFVSNRAHLVMPWHKVLDGAKEVCRGDQSLGTTQRGIGPCYADKASRSGLRVGDLLDIDYFQQRLKNALDEKNDLLVKVYDAEPLNYDDILNQYREYAKRLSPMIDDTALRLADARAAGKTLVFEGAQGTLLDLDHGSYPYVTSSSASALGMAAGTGTPCSKLGKLVGVLKAYTTRVGGGPFPTELNNQAGEDLRKVGAEFGATTGRPRRCGWLDLVATDYVCTINGVDAIALTKLDVLSQFDTILVCNEYYLNGETTDRFPALAKALERVQPRYVSLPGWKTDITAVRRMKDLPPNCRAYIDYIEKALGVPIEIVSIGPGRDETIIV